jgi:hypothetical protein
VTNTTALDLDRQRAEFEAWLSENMPNAGAVMRQVAEKSWQAALARRSTSSVSEGEMPELPDETEPQWWFDLHAASAALEDFGATGNAASVCKIANQLLAATKAAAPADAPKVSLAHLLDLVEQAQALPDWSTTAPITLTPIQIAYVAGKLADLRAAQVPATGIPTAGEVAKAVQVFTCKGKGGEYELVGYSNGAGPKRGESIVVYRDTTKPDVFYHRSREDFSERMEWLGGRAPISTTHTSGEVEKAGWISVEDDRKPKGRTPILVTVDYVRYGEYEDGTSGEWRGQIVTEGEYVPQHGEVGDYFTSYSSPHGDGEAVTHWMPIPAPAQPKDTTDTRRDA